MAGGTGRHRSDPKKLLKIYEIYAEWLEALDRNEEAEYIKNAIGRARSSADDKFRAYLDRRTELKLITTEQAEAIMNHRMLARQQARADQNAFIAQKPQDWPKIEYGPKTLASDEYHTILIILDKDATPEQMQYVSKRFFNLIEWSWTRHDDILGIDWITDYLEPLAKEFEDEGLTRIQ